MGIGKRALLEDYYYDEIAVVLEMYNELHRVDREQEETVDPMAFFGDGGERVG